MVQFWHKGFNIRIPERSLHPNWLTNYISKQGIDWEFNPKILPFFPHQSFSDHSFSLFLGRSGNLGFHRVIDAFPSRSVGYLYCCGTRAEEGGSPLILDEINNYGRKGRIFMVHFRNVRGSLATAGAFEETLLDDGDMNMFRILLELRRVGFDGCLNPDHIPAREGDGPAVHQGRAYSGGYIKAMLAALAAL